MSDSNPYKSPMGEPRRYSGPAGVDATSTFAWWRARRLHYNFGLVVAGVLAFICYLTVCFVLLPRVLDPSEINETPFTMLLQGMGYLLAMGVANVFFFLGPVSERVVRPTNVERYRVVCYRMGFWFSCLLPFGVPALLTGLVLFFPGHFKH